MSAPNGGIAGPVPPDVPFPVTLFGCSGNMDHADGCDGTCEAWEPSEVQVKLMNLKREFARNGMVMVGIPAGVPVPISGIQVDLIELLCRMMAIEEMVFPLLDMDRDTFDDQYRETKLEFLSDVLNANKDRIKKQRVANALGINEGRPPILGPGGTPIG